MIKHSKDRCIECKHFKGVTNVNRYWDEKNERISSSAGNGRFLGTITRAKCSKKKTTRNPWTALDCGKYEPLHEQFTLKEYWKHITGLEQQ